MKHFKFLLTLLALFVGFNSVIGCTGFTSSSTGASADAEDDDTEDDDTETLGAFTISGIYGGTDVTADTNLKSGTVATVSWSASTNASSYDVTVFENDGTTVKCATINATGLTVSFPSCNLTVGTNYKVTVLSKNAVNTKLATNDLFAFLVYNIFEAGNVPTYFVMENGSFTINPFEDSASCAGTCTLVISSASNGAHGTAGSTASTLTYTPTASYTGTDTFAFVIDDGNGGTINASLTINVVTPYTWIGGGGNANWNTNLNWCGSVNATNTACENGLAPNSAVTASHLAIFDGTCSSNCSPSINAASAIYGLRLNTGYTGTITQAAGNTLTVGAGAWTQAAGTFTGGNSAITVGGNLTISGGNFTSTSGTLTVAGSWNPTGASMSFNSGTLAFSCTAACTITPAGLTYNNVSFAGTSATFAMGGATMTIAGNLGLGGTTSQAINTGILNVGGNLTTSGIGATGSTHVRIVGNAGGQTLTGVGTASIPRLTIVAGANNVTLSGVLGLSGDYTLTSVGSLTTAGSTLKFMVSNATLNIAPGTEIYDDVIFTGSTATYNLGTFSLELAGDITFSGLVTEALINNGSIFASGDVFTTDFGARGSAELTLEKPAGIQTITGIDGASLPHVLIIAAGDIVLSGTVVAAGDFRNQGSGAFDATGSTLKFVGAGNTYNFEPGAGTYENIYFATDASEIDLQGDTVLIAGNLELGDTSPGLELKNGTLSVGGDVTARNEGYAGNAVIRLTGNALGQTITSVGANAILPEVDIAAGGDNVTLNGTVKIYNSFTLTSGSITSAGSTLQLSGIYQPGTITPGAATYHNVIIDGSCSNHTLVGNLQMTGDLTLGDDTCPATTLSGGTIAFAGNLSFVNLGFAGTTELIFEDAGSSSVTMAGTAETMAGNITVNLTGGTLNTLSTVTWNSAGQDLNIVDGDINLGGNLTVADQIDLNTHTLTKNGFVLTAGGAPVADGALLNGTVDP